MKKKDKKTLIIGISAVLLIALGIGYYFYTTGNLKLTTEDRMIGVTLLDEDGNVIKPFSVVQGVPGVSSMIFTVTATNTGAKDLQCNIVSTKVNGATNTAFDSSFSKTAKLVPSTSPKKAAWTSNAISVSQFEGLSQPVSFAVTIRCTYTSGASTITLSDKTGSLPLTITQDESGSFDVNVGTGGLPSEFCGDGTCNADETASSCPEDCAVANYVKFRTSDTTYVLGTGVGYTTTCGSTLIRYGATTGACTDKNCANTPDFYVPSSSGTTKFFYRSSTEVCICDPGKTSGYPRKYTTSDSDASNVDNTAISIDSSREVAC